jgi:lycopene beta-cyclase
MTYAGFLLLFLVPPILVLALLARRRITSRWSWGVLAVMGLAVIYTGPWDHFIIEQGVWSYPPGRVLGPAIGNVPIEEYAFFLLQVLLTGLVLLMLTEQTAAPRPPESKARVRGFPRQLQKRSPGRRHLGQTPVGADRTRPESTQPATALIDEH